MTSSSATPPPMTRDALDRVLSGDQTSQRELIRGYGALVWSLCRRLDPEPEDAYQECWEKVVKGLRRFDPDGSAKLSTWIAVVTNRHLVDRHRSRSSRGVEVELDRWSPPSPRVDERFDRTERIADLERALADLPEPQRRAVILHYLRDLPLDAIADSEEVAVGTIKSRLHRARARLTEILGGGP